jgi:hypothetical protein
MVKDAFPPFHLGMRFLKPGVLLSVLDDEIVHKSSNTKCDVDQNIQRLAVYICPSK